MAQQASDHERATAAAAAEAEELREALVAKHVHDTDRLLAGHADAMHQAELRQAPQSPDRSNPRQRMMHVPQAAMPAPGKQQRQESLRALAANTA